MMITSTGCALILSVLLSSTHSGDRVRIRTSPAPGLGLEAGIGRQDPSDVIRIGQRDYVFYTRVTPETPLYPAGYAGEIWYAVSEDDGQSWRELGQVLGHGEDERFDSLGVFDPNILRDAQGDLHLYYSGIGPNFNFRFEEVRRVEPISIGIARLELMEGRVTAHRLNNGEPILNPSERSAKGFDSLRVTGPTPILRNGLYQLYYRGFDFANATGASALGLAIAENPAGPYLRQHEGRAVVPFGGDVLLGIHEGGVMALLTSGQRGLHWAMDGEHFALLPVQASGILTNAGIWRSEDDSSTASPWGLHVARSYPHPYLERFDIEVPAELELPPVTTTPVPSNFQSAAWGPHASWLGLHREGLEALAREPQDLLFLGDQMTEGFGGHSRAASAPGNRVWTEEYGSRRAINLGLDGDRTQHLIWRLAHGLLDQRQTRIVVLQIGGNNLESDSVDEVTAGVEAILERILFGLRRCEVLLCSIPAPVGSDTEALVRVESLNARLKSLTRRPRVRFLDISGRFSDPQGQALPELFEGTSGRLSESGYREWASALDPILEELEERVVESASRRLDELEAGDR
jgi:lysophospholipase L1-like esterase